MVRLGAMNERMLFYFSLFIPGLADVYVFAAALLFRQDDGIYTMGFILVSLWSGFYLLLNLLNLPNIRFVKDPGTMAAKAAWAGRLGLVSILL